MSDWNENVIQYVIRFDIVIAIGFLNSISRIVSLERL